jgi:predicted regulator of amino acid metabolism with ACT domain
VCRFIPQLTDFGREKLPPEPPPICDTSLSHVMKLAAHPKFVVFYTAKIIGFRVRDILVDQAKMLKKIAVTLKKISKYLINILAMLYFPFEQKLEK